MLRTLVLQEPEHPDITLTLSAETAPETLQYNGRIWAATHHRLHRPMARKRLPVHAPATPESFPDTPDSSVADRRITEGVKRFQPRSNDVGGWRHTDSRMPSDNLPQSPSTAEVPNVDEAVAFYEDVYASQDIHIGQAHRRRIHMAVPRRRRTTTSSRWAHPLSTRTAGGTIGQHGTYILAWTTTPGIVLDVDTRDAIAMPPTCP